MTKRNAKAKPKRKNANLVFGAKKYVGFHLLLARWLRNYAQAKDYCYVTLGGTELRDCESLFFIDERLTASCLSYETDADRFTAALLSQTRLAAKALRVDVIQGDIFEDFRRSDDRAHIFFFDFLGIFGSGFDTMIEQAFQRRTIREGDVMFVTSYLGRNIGYSKIFRKLDGEFMALGVTDDATRKDLYRWAHPSFTLFRGLEAAGMGASLSLQCFGCAHYFDSSAMGLWGYLVEPGQTQFANLVRDPMAVRYEVTRGIHIRAA